MQDELITFVNHASVIFSHKNIRLITDPWLFGSASNNGWEGIPWESEGAYDWYQRPVYKDMLFANVRIPRGTNAVFADCTFVGVTWVETMEEVSDPNWNFAGAVAPDGSGGYDYQFDGLTADSEGVTYPNTRDVSNNIRFHDCTFLGSIAGDVPSEFNHLNISLNWNF